MAAFRAAGKAGIPGIELDVHLTRDGKLAVIHDDTTERVARGQNGEMDRPGQAGRAAGALKVEDSDFALLSALDIGSWKDPAFSVERIPLLDEVLEEFGASFYFDIEIKSRTVGDAGLETLLAKALRRHGMERRCLVSSFNPFALRRFKPMSAGIPTAIIWSESSELYWFLRRGEGRWIGAVDILKPERSLLRRRRLLADLRRPLLPWTVDTEKDARLVLECGAAGFISNRPQDLARLQSPVS